MKKLFYALVLPISVQIGALIWLNYNGDFVDSLMGFTMKVILFSLGWGLVVLIPVSIAQILCARSLIKADCRDHERFLVGVLNPGLAISVLVVAGVAVQNTWR